MVFFWLLIYTLACISKVSIFSFAQAICKHNVHPKMQCSDIAAECPVCENDCGFQGCDCTDSAGSLLTPSPPQPQPDRPKHCSTCEFKCLLIPECPPPTTLCTETQLNSYILKCPECIPNAGCRVGCPCKDCEGNIYDPPSTPPQLVGQKGCPVCVPLCPPIPFCPLIRQCTKKQLSTYQLQCPECIPSPGCKLPGCNCIDTYGNELTPPRNSPQPPRPKGCPVCDPACLFLPFPCEPDPRPCTDEQLETYVLKLGEISGTL